MIAAIINPFIMMGFINKQWDLIRFKDQCFRFNGLELHFLGSVSDQMSIVLSIFGLIFLFNN